MRLEPPPLTRLFEDRLWYLKSDVDEALVLHESPPAPPLDPEAQAHWQRHFYEAMKMPSPSARGEAPLPAPVCHVCGKSATCIGEYETCTGNEQHACDACCGHGNEDGHCRPVEAPLPAAPPASGPVVPREDLVADLRWWAKTVEGRAGPRTPWESGLIRLLRLAADALNDKEQIEAAPVASPSDAKK